MWHCLGPPARTLALVGAAGVLVVACTGVPDDEPPPPPTAGAPAATAHEGTSAWGTYRVRWTAEPAPIPVGKLVTLRVGVERVDGAVPGDLRVEVDATMPDHGHGMTLRPTVRRADDGGFVADGMLFHMPGRWEVAVDVVRGDDVERATFPVDLQ